MENPPERSGSRAPRDWHASLRAAGPYVGLGLQLAMTMVFFVGGGYLLDRWLGTLPWLLLAGAFVGIAAIILQIYRVSAEMEARNRARRGRRS
ncbi:MAG: AtpZ/AtpI family protein [Bacteroidetes bacterium]|nr:MAG: AtpZ/AtpI family protein [Bacteroidota bacterium]GIV58127.1 MAG: hypothetical protein KatS3mg042_1040 [Rhodothermaceae bacterium]